MGKKKHRFAVVRQNLAAFVWDLHFHIFPIPFSFASRVP